MIYFFRDDNIVIIFIVLKKKFWRIKMFYYKSVEVIFWTKNMLR